jgi:hypothetical protein
MIHYKGLAGKLQGKSKSRTPDVMPDVSCQPLD